MAATGYELQNLRGCICRSLQGVGLVSSREAKSAGRIDFHSVQSRLVQKAALDPKQFLSLFQGWHRQASISAVERPLSR